MAQNRINPNMFVNWLRRWRLWAGATFLIAAPLLWWQGGRAPTASSDATFAARRGPLDITVLDGGSIQALESQEVKCEVRVGGAGIKILKLVEEGYQVTPEDIRNKKVLVELDSSELQKQIVQQDTQYENALAMLIDAQEGYEIQMNQNLSDIKAAEQKARFGRMDFDKFLGSNVTRQVVADLGIEKRMVSVQTNVAERTRAVIASVAAQKPTRPSTNSVSSLSSSPAPVVAPDRVAAPLVVPGAVDFSKYARLEMLGDGEAKQKLRKFEDDAQVARKELGQAQATIDGTKRLYGKGFVTKTDLQRDEIAYENSRLKVVTAETARDLFLTYEFRKNSEEFLSKYDEAMREVIRARGAAVSKLAQAEAKLRSAQGQFNIQNRARKDLYDQLDRCVITASKPGLVVYGSGNDEGFNFGEERIREGATVRERQSIITIPNMTRMSVRVKIHESYIKKIKKGQKARITVDAFADKVLEGEVTKVGVLPDSQNRWLNPDLKVYLTTITIQGTQDWLKPGMSAKVEIIVSRLPDVVYVPVQAVVPFDNKQICFVAGSGKPARRVVEVGEFNDEFIEIKSGLKAGEVVLLRPTTAAAESEPADKKSVAPPAKSS